MSQPHRPWNQPHAPEIHKATPPADFVPGKLPPLPQPRPHVGSYRIWTIAEQEAAGFKGYEYPENSGSGGMVLQCISLGEDHWNIDFWVVEPPFSEFEGPNKGTPRGRPLPPFPGPQFIHNDAEKQWVHEGWGKTVPVGQIAT